jgi:uncharacterized phiE125 gp8 family phage protein
VGLTLITPAATLPVTLAEVKLYLKVESADEDALLTTLIKAAVGHIAERCGRPLAAEVWQLTLDAFSDTIELPKAPVTDATVRYVDSAGLSQDVDLAVYSLDLVSQPQWVVRNSDQVWPTPIDGVNAVSVEFTAGYDDTTLPQELKLAVMMLVEHWYSNRGVAQVGNTVNDLPFAVEALIGPYRTLWISA